MCVCLVVDLSLCLFLLLVVIVVVMASNLQPAQRPTKAMARTMCALCNYGVTSVYLHRLRSVVLCFLNLLQST